jgi:hypothetical protein
MKTKTLWAVVEISSGQITEEEYDDAHRCLRVYATKKEAVETAKQPYYGKCRAVKFVRKDKE